MADIRSILAALAVGGAAGSGGTIGTQALGRESPPVVSPHPLQTLDRFGSLFRTASVAHWTVKPSGFEIITMTGYTGSGYVVASFIDGAMWGQPQEVGWYELPAAADAQHAHAVASATPQAGAGP